MQTVRLIVGKGRNPFSFAIKVVTDSRWSHVGIICGEFVYEAAAFKGVVKTPLAEFKNRYKGNWEIFERYVPSTKAVYAKAESLLGCGYDYFGVAGLLFRLDIGDKSRYQCGEFAAVCMGIKRPDYYWRADPQDIWEDGVTLEKGYE